MLTNVISLIGYKLGSKLAKVVSIENKGLIIAHRIEGRRRYTSLALKGNVEACTLLEESIRAIEYIKECKVNPITGSVIVSYDTDETNIDMLFDSISHVISGKHALQESSMLPLPVITISDNINEALRGIRDNIKVFFNHTEPLFVSRLIGAGFLIYGISRMINQGDRPSGPQLFWWGIGLLIRQSHKHENLK